MKTNKTLLSDVKFFYYSKLKLLEVFKNEEINEMVYEENENQDEKLRWDLKLY